MEESARKEISGADSANVLDALRVRYLGKKGDLTSVLKGLKDLSVEQKREIGGIANKLKSLLEDLIRDKQENLLAAGGLAGDLDHTLPGRPYHHGHRHLVTMVMDEMQDIFLRMGFDIADGPDIESDFYNFEALNFPPDHPARDEQDTFFVEGGMLLRTHTTPIQVRELEKRKPPFKILAPGRVFRNEAVSARSYCMFHQIDGFYVDERVTLADLKGVLEAFAYEFFGEGLKLRYRTSFFPFTEPSAEVDVNCFLCGGKGCQVCKYEGWLEILGCGMIDPNVFRSVGYDPEQYTGYAFGIGVERIAMLKYQFNDIRLLYDNDIRFIRQFR